jgi:pimeloyl-ACP methyl ester carboxylesterase
MWDDVKRVRTELLEIGYLELGRSDGAPVVLLHGWPDGPLGWADVAGPIAAAGYRVLVPFLRGFGPTRFLDEKTMRSGQLCALASDLMEFADALRLRRFAVAGHDWGARAAYIASALWPERMSGCVAISVGWGTNAPGQALSLEQSRNYWYHWFMATPRGEAVVRDSRREFTRFLWETWSPGWAFSEREFEATADGFENPDWADVTLNSYRGRWGWADGDVRYAALERRLNPTPVISAPALVLHGADDACNGVATSDGKEKFFSGPYERRVIEGCGHFPQRERADVVAAAVAEFLGRR